MRLKQIQIGGASLALDILESQPCAVRDPNGPRRVFHLADDCQRELLAKTTLADEPDFAATLAMLPEVIDRARDLMG